MKKEEYTHTLLITYDDGCLEVFKIIISEESAKRLIQSFRNFYSLHRDNSISSGTLLLNNTITIPYSKIRKLQIREYKESDENL